MGEHSRYSLTQSEAGLDGGILKNKLNIQDQQLIDDIETLLLNDAYDHFFKLIQRRTVTFDLAYLCTIHKYFLGTLYPWAGKIRTIDLSKDETLFAPIKFIDTSVKTFKAVLKRSIPSSDDPKLMVARKLAVIHNEFNVLHPFREGNGRTIRLFLDLLAVSIGYHPIDWSKRSHKTYIQACVNGMVQNHEPMKRIIYTGLSKKK